MVNYPVFKAFILDLVTSLLTAAAAWLAVPGNVEKIGVTDFLVPVIVGLAGAAGMALRRWRIENK